MSTFDLPNDISNSSVGSAKYVDASKLQENYVKIESEWQDGTNTDFNIAAGEITSLNTSMESANTIGNAGTTTINADTANITTLNATLGTGLTPIGAVTAFMSTTAPDGWLECDGSAVLKGSYTELYAVIGDRYGTVEGDSTRFRLPDLRGQFLRGFDNGAGTDPDAGSRTTSGDETVTGDAVGTKQDYATKQHFHSHTHQFGGQNERLDSGSNVSLYEVKSYGTGNSVLTTSEELDSEGDAEVGVNATPGTSITATNSSTESRPTNISVMWIIRAE